MSAGFAPHRCRTGIPGVCIAQVRIHRRVVPHFVATCGRRSFKFNMERLGRAGALRRAITRRAEYEKGGVL